MRTDWSDGGKESYIWGGMKAVSSYFRNLEPALCLYRFVLAFLPFMVGLAFGGVLGGWRHAGRVQYLFFSSFWLVLKKISFWC